MFAMYFIGYDAPWKLVVCAIGLVLLGIPQGVNNIITYAMIGDTVDYLEWKTGERGGVYTWKNAYTKKERRIAEGGTDISGPGRENSCGE